MKNVGRMGLLYSLGLVFFFSLVHYKGFDKDAAIYLLQVMNYLQPERFVDDVPFMFGNQDSFSIYSPVIAVFFKVLGVNVGGMAATFFTFLAFGVALIAFVCKWSKKFNTEQWRMPILFALFILMANKTYGSGSFYLPLFESYLVARVLSCVLMVAGLVFIYDKNKYVSLVFFIFSVLMHPLMGGWALLLWLFIFFPRIKLPIIVLSLLFPLTGFLHVGRLDFYPDDWRPLYISPGLDEFITYSCLLAFWLMIYRHFKGGVLSAFSISMFWTSLIGFYLQFAGSYTEHLLLYQAQPFRAQWLCMLPVVPVFAIFVRNCMKSAGNLVFRDYASFILGLFAIAGAEWMDLCPAIRYMWLTLLTVVVVMCFSSVGDKNGFVVRSHWVNFLFFMGLVLLIFDSVVCNYIQLAIEQGMGDAGLAATWFDLPSYLAVVRMFVLIAVILACLFQKKYGYVLLFSIAFCCASLKLLPIVGLILCVVPNLGMMPKRFLLAFSFSYSFFELLGSLYRFNSMEKLPLEGGALTSILMFVALFIVVYFFVNLKECLGTKKMVAPLIALLVSFSMWDVYRWDARNESIIINERQMDAFFDVPIFPQVKDRGKMLFTVDYENPKQSRINFMTGAYADASIYVGEVFYKEQYLESNRRRNALLTETLQENRVHMFNERIISVYHNPDTLLSRVHYLCGAGEITHFATDYANMPLPKQDSVYLDVKQKFVWLYGCSK
ncbi:hypothetical protein [Fibrobacter sp. UBA2449]|uniref:hypothetical protein n=1 Tax=Fibrobacter sp. UBA2449 TaxID=1946529 RepID=UPI0025B88EE3|nr:hypothetical protein [Fibrobacter sp. UBA2449]